MAFVCRGFTYNNFVSIIIIIVDAVFPLWQFLQLFLFVLGYLFQFPGQILLLHLITFSL